MPIFKGTPNNVPIQKMTEKGALTSSVGLPQLDVKNGLPTAGSSADRASREAGDTLATIASENSTADNIASLDLTRVCANVIQSEPESGAVELVDAGGRVIGLVSYCEVEHVVLCFTPGTRIATLKGDVPVEDLQPGDKVFTRDSGAQPVRWVGRRDLSPEDLRAHPEFQPVMIRRGALGSGLPARDMLVSPQHRMLVTSDVSAKLFDEREVLVAARHLTGIDGVEQVHTGSISYLHVMFDQHEIVLADGAWSESFQPDENSLRGIGAQQRDDVLTQFPEFRTSSGFDRYGSARMSLKKHEVDILFGRFK
jgi:serralysin